MRENLKNIKILLDPWLKHERLAFFLYGFCYIVLNPAAEYFCVLIPEKIIAQLEVTSEIGPVVKIGLTYFLLALFCFCLSAFIRDTYYDKRATAIKGVVQKDIMDKALLIDQENFSNPEFLDSYKMVTEEYPDKTIETLEVFFQWIGRFVQILVMSVLIASKGTYVVIVIIGLSLLCTLAQVIYTKHVTKVNFEGIRPQRKFEYVRRLFFEPEVVEDVKVTRMMPKLRDILNIGNKQLVDIQVKYQYENVAFEWLIYLSRAGINFIVPLYIVIAYLTGHLSSIAAVSTLLVASNSLQNALNDFGGWNSRIALYAEYGKKILNFFNIESIIENTHTAIKVSNKPVSVDIKSLKYSYLNSKFSLNIKDLHIKEGEKIAIVGENGAGKSTLMKLLLRIYDTQNGEIRIDDKNIKDIDIDSLRSSIGYVPQRPIIYATSVEDFLSPEDSNNEDIKKLLKLVNVKASPSDNLTKEFEDDGLVLSGGQNQLLTFARIFKKDYSLVLLDEPSSALDPLNEERMLKLIEDKIHTTTIIVAHRLSSIRNMDRIIVMSNGKIVEEGNHKQLMKNKNLYYEMFNTQAERYKN